MLNPSPVERDDLNVGHARVAGWRSGRDGFSRELERVRVGSLALATDEILYVPRLRLRPAASERFADAAFESLRDLAAAAQLDPAPGTAGHLSCRFSSRARYFAWLVGLWLGGSVQREAAAVATKAGTLGEWQRREVLRRGSLMIAVAGHLARAGLAVSWIGRFTPQDYALAEVTIAQSFGIELSAGGSQSERDEVTSGEAPSGEPGSAQKQAEDKAQDNTLAEILLVSRKLSDLGNEWRQLPFAGRRLLLSAVALADLPARPSPRAFVAAVAVTAAGKMQPAPEGLAREMRRYREPASPPVSRIRKAPPELSTSKVCSSALVRGVPSAASGTSPSSGGAGTAVEGTAPSTANTSAKRAPRERQIRVAESAVSQAVLFLSDFAGLLFLLNAFTALGLYPDFASAGPPRLGVSPLWLIDRVGCFWFGRRYRRDALHHWIAANSCGGKLPSDWSVDPAWRRSWRMGERKFVVQRGGRLTVWDGRGFPIEDIATAFRHRMSTRHSHRRGRCSSGWRGLRLPTERTERWIACLAHFLDARIRVATGDHSIGLNALAQSGELIVDELDATARFTFEPQTVPLRLAGLDRDPCWQPAEGRSFRFHFA